MIGCVELCKRGRVWAGDGREQAGLGGDGVDSYGPVADVAGGDRPGAAEGSSCGRPSLQCITPYIIIAYNAFYRDDTTTVTTLR